MGKLINIDNGGTLTDVCVSDGGRVWRTKTLTTPFDLSQCFIDGLVKASRLIYGRDDLVALLSSTEHIRYSTTQGTNALVERKGPRLGLLLTGTLTPAALQADAQSQGLFAALVGERWATVELALEGPVLEAAAAKAINRLASMGANRIVVAHGGHDRQAAEGRLKRGFLRQYPQHLLGAVPLLYSHEVVGDDDDVRRCWTALFNAFLHPAMERFLYNAEHKLRAAKSLRPLLVFRNDGHSARVAKTIALKTYSSGPRGGMEGARALAGHYGFEHLLSIDIGGTTTDIGEVRGGGVREHAHGSVEGVAVSFPLCNVVSVGVGGSSIIRVDAQRALQVGPQSVGSAPGPACFGLGGNEATITDAFLVAGLLDPASFFGGELTIDAARARRAIAQNVTGPLGLADDDTAADLMESAWVATVVAGMRAYTTITPQTTLAAFGGAGPFVVCRVAEGAGITRVLIPGLAAVFSAYGLGFSDIAQSYEAPVADADGMAAAHAGLLQRTRRGMYAEGFALEDCEVHTSWRVDADGAEPRHLPYDGRWPPLAPGERALLQVQAVRRLPHPTLAGEFGGEASPAVSTALRSVRVDGQTLPLPLYRTEQQPAGAVGQGPAVLEDSYFTCRIDAGWRFEINASGDILLSREARTPQNLHERPRP